MKDVGSVLLVDDDKINNYINERLILKTGLSNHIVVKNNGEEGLLYLEKVCLPENKLPSLILLDINMPVINGIEFIEILKDKYPHILILSQICILSTSENLSDLQKLKKVGDFFRISKPLTRSKLLDIYNLYFKKNQE